MMNPLTRIFKSGKYTILRAQIKNNKIKIYDENETSLDLENLKLEDFIIPLIHLNGIKFTSNNFTIDINLVQLMIVSPDEELNNCIINIKNKKSNVKENNNLTTKTLEENIIIENIDNKNIDNEITFNLDKQEKVVLNKQELDKQEIDKQEIDKQEIDKQQLDKQEIDNQERLLLDSKDEIDNQERVLLDSKDELDNQQELDIQERLIKQEGLDLDKKIKENDINLTEVNLDEIKEENDKIDIKDAEMVYYEIYKAARKKAKQIKQSAIEAYLEAKKIKNQYMLQDIDDSSDSEIEELSNTL